ncbi:helix-hairpin-helix domain-containing protein [Sporosarcina sp. G11-34]|uniref:helix-hairpin-helix domain-containing protein n=1 Tax=Sporosarcina sp. G11-34 TaxID=2849605 RepID=UPI0022A92C6A|nr:helix-hairpin-helix domain-containing protein [Sporosarcina sp. G11-34]MCZ2259383.1 helix-hairpin-helix domain-containing protein [Sporosarcina sp. G11-34]
MDAAKERVTVLFLSFVSSNWRKFLIPIIIFAALLFFLFFPREQSNSANIVMSDQNPFPELIEEPKLEEIVVDDAPNLIIVDVKGAVLHPGVYTMQEGDRLVDAISAAGGYLPNADSRMLNHAMKLADEFVIYVPLEGEEVPESTLNVVSEPSSTPSTASEGSVNINTSDEAGLMTIPGIGPSKAAAIIAYREEHGLFSATTDLMKVSGIGQKTFDKLESFIKIK